MRFCLTVVLVLILSVLPAHAKRVALVIGNDTYTTLPSLNNATADASAVAGKLKALGFDVILKTNAGRRDLYRSLEEFGSRLVVGDTALVFYAGHGVQANGHNYLIPANAAVEVEADLPSEALTADAFLTTMANAGVGLSLLILDACRDNPLPQRTRSATRGLTITSAPAGAQGSAIIYSAGPGQTAEDGLVGGHGVFTGELLKVLDRPGLKLEDVFKETARAVATNTGNRQRPWMNASMTQDFYFLPAGATPVPTDTLPVVQASADREIVFWNSIVSSDDPAAYRAYLAQYPQGDFVALAQIRIQQVEAKRVADQQMQLAKQALPALTEAEKGCLGESRLRATEPVPPEEVRFRLTNQTGQTVIGYWLNYDGQRQHYFDLAPNQQAEQPTFRTHPWVIATQQGRCLLVLNPPGEFVVR